MSVIAVYKVFNRRSSRKTPLIVLIVTGAIIGFASSYFSGYSIAIAFIIPMLALLAIPEKTTLLAILLLPFQQTFTIQLMGTLRICDILFVLASLGYLIRLATGRRYASDKSVGNLYVPLILLSVVFIGTLYNSFSLGNLIAIGTQGMSIVHQFPFLVSYSKLLIAASSYFSLVSTLRSVSLSRVLSYMGFGATIMALYTIVQFLVLNTIHTWPHLPGEVLNLNTSFSYGLRRPWGFFIEPGALGTYLSIMFAVTYLMNLPRTHIMRVIIGCGAFLTFSTVAILAVTSVIVIRFSTRKNFALFTLYIIAIIAIFLGFDSTLSGTLWEATFGKVLSGSYSFMDRLNNVVISYNIFVHHFIFGVGYGGFGLVRNIYAINTAIPWKNFYDIPNSMIAELLSELGLVGSVAYVFLWIHSIRIAKTSTSSIAWMSVLLVMAVTGFSQSEFTTDFLWVIYGLLFSTDIVSRQNAPYLKSKIRK